MSPTIHTTHILASAGLTVIQRKQGMQRQGTVELLPEKFDCNTRDGMVEIEDALSECPIRIGAGDQAIVEYG